MNTERTQGRWYAGSGINQMVSDDTTLASLRVADREFWFVFTTALEYGDIGADARLMAAAPELLDALWEGIEMSGFNVAGPTDWRAAEDGEPRWICDARAAIAKAEGRK